MVTENLQISFFLMSNLESFHPTKIPPAETTELQLAQGLIFPLEIDFRIEGEGLSNFDSWIPRARNNH